MGQGRRMCMVCPTPPQGGASTLPPPPPPLPTLLCPVKSHQRYGWAEARSRRSSTSVCCPDGCITVSCNEVSATQHLSNRHIGSRLNIIHLVAIVILPKGEVIACLQR